MLVEGEVGGQENARILVPLVFDVGYGKNVIGGHLIGWKNFLN